MIFSAAWSSLLGSLLNAYVAGQVVAAMAKKGAAQSVKDSQAAAEEERQAANDWKVPL